MSSRYSFYKKNGKTGLLHRLIAERELGRKLRSDEIVHHKNNNSKDNRPRNLKVMSDLKHRHESSPDVKMVTLRCKNCGKKFSMTYSRYKWLKENDMTPKYDSLNCAREARKRS